MLWQWKIRVVIKLFCIDEAHFACWDTFFLNICMTTLRVRQDGLTKYLKETDMEKCILLKVSVQTQTDDVIKVKMRLCLCNSVFRYKFNHQIFWLIYKHFIDHGHNRDVLIVSICFCFYTTLCNIYPHWIILKEPIRDCTLTVCICALRSSRARIKTENMRSKLRPLTSFPWFWYIPTEHNNTVIAVVALSEM